MLPLSFGRWGYLQSFFLCQLPLVLWVACRALQRGAEVTRGAACAEALRVGSALSRHQTVSETACPHAVRVATIGDEESLADTADWME